MEIILKTNKFPKPIFISLFPPLPTYYYPLFIPPYLLSFPFSSLFLLNHMFTPSYLLSFLFLSPLFFFYKKKPFSLSLPTVHPFFFFSFSLSFTSHQLHLFFFFLTSFPREHHHRMTVM